MPQFQLNVNDSRYDELNDFAKGYVEAMFFTNGDTGDDNEDSLNELGVEALTQDSINKIAADCARFEAENADNLARAYALPPGQYARHGGIDAARAGNLFWYVRQGHGVSWLDDQGPDDDSACLDALQEASRTFGEVYDIYVENDEIHY